MRKLALLALAFLLAIVAACEIALPFDRSLIPEEGGASGDDASLGQGEDVATPEDSSPTTDAFVPSAEAGDAAADSDAPAGDGGAGDGSADGAPSGDAAPDAADGASDAGAPG